VSVNAAPNGLKQMTSTCRILELNEANLEHCKQLLQAGQVVGVPTETVYGLAGNALCESSVRKIFEVKGRPLIDPLIVHFASIRAAEAHVVFNDAARELAAKFWPGPLTIVLPKKDSISDLVTAGLTSVAIRIPGHPIFRSLLDRLDFPLAAPSANPFGYVSPTRPEHVAKTLGEFVPAVLDGGPCMHGVESTIVDLRDAASPKILRPGPISAEALGISSENSIESTDERAQAAPGMMTQHYSPNTMVKLFEHSGQPTSISRHDAVLYNTKPATQVSEKTYWLSESGDTREIAHNLFSMIQKLDGLNYHCLHIERVTESGIGIAVNDRLSRAAARRSN